MSFGLNASYQDFISSIKNGITSDMGFPFPLLFFCHLTYREVGVVKRFMESEEGNSCCKVKRFVEEEEEIVCLCSQTFGRRRLRFEQYYSFFCVC